MEEVVSEVNIIKDKVSPQGGVFSDLEIKKALEIGHIVCDPAPRPEQINGSSLDVTLGYYFYHAGGSDDHDGLFNPFDEADVRRYFGEYKMAKPWASVRRKVGSQAVSGLEYLAGIPDEHPVIVLGPNERILAHTHEFVGILAPGTSSMQARSTTGRIGVSACYCAGWGDPGYVNRWTMEVHNLNEKEHVVLPIGWRIAQLVFSGTGPVGSEYASASGNYQQSPSSDLETIKRLWTPEQMLPRAYNNELVLPPPVIGLGTGLR
jgi:dCTP deaminase